MTVVLNDRADFTLDAFRRVTVTGEGVVIGAAAVRAMAEARAGFERLLRADPHGFIYGVTTRPGVEVGTVIPPEEQLGYARRFRGVGRGFGRDCLDQRVVRGIVFARLADFVGGHAKVRPELARRVAALLAGPLPQVPLDGQQGAGHVLRLAEAIFALSVEAFRAPLDAYDEALDGLRGDEADRAVLRRLRGHLRGADAAGRLGHQAPVSYRIIGQVLGQAQRGVQAVLHAATTALGSVTENPVYLPPGAGHPSGRVLSTGGFHNGAAGPAIDWLTAAWADLALVAQRQVTAMHSPTSGLPHLLAPAGFVAGASGGATNLFGWVATGLVEEARAAAAPTLLPASINDTQNDIASPVFGAYRSECRAPECLAGVLAILALVARQALFAAGRQPAPPLAGLLTGVRSVFPPVEAERAGQGAQAGELASILSRAALTGQLDLPGYPAEPGGGSGADDPPRDRAPALRVGDRAAVHQRPHPGQVAGHQGAVLGVVGVDDHRVTRLAQPVRRQPQPAQLVVVIQRVMHQRGGAAPGKLAHDGEDAGERGLLHAGPVGGAKHGHPQAGHASGQLGEHLHGLSGSGVVDLTRRGRQPRCGVASQVEPRVHRDAVPADRDARPVQVAVRLAVGRRYDLVHVDACGAGEPGELVGERDVDVAVGRLGQLGELGGLGAAEIPHPVRPGQVLALVEVEYRLVEPRGALAAAGVDAADQLGIAPQVGEDRPAGHPFRAVAEQEVQPGAQARARGQGRPQPPPGGVHRKRGLVADHAARPQPGRDAGGGCVDGAIVGLAGRVGHQRDDHHDDVAFRNGRGRVGGRGQQAGVDDLVQPPGQAGFAGERRAAVGYQAHDCRVHVGTANPGSLPGHLDGERQADLAEAHDRDGGRPGDRQPPGHLAARWPAGSAATGRSASPGRPSASRTAVQPLDAASTAAATSIVSTPCRMVTISAGLPSTASRKFSSSVASASRLATAYRIRSPSDAPWNG